MKLPQTKKGDITMLRTQRKTGLILNNDNTFYTQEGCDYFKVFSDIDNAKKYIDLLVEENIEYLLYDFEGNCLEQVIK